MVANKLIELQEKEFEAKLMSEKSKILADLNSAISELQELGFDKNKIIDYLVSKNYRLTELGINILAVHNEDPLTKDISTSGNTFKIL